MSKQRKYVAVFFFFFVSQIVCAEFTKKNRIPAIPAGKFKFHCQFFISVTDLDLNGNLRETFLRDSTNNSSRRSTYTD